MDSLRYKGCAVPLCDTTSKSNPNKLFVNVPREKNKRDKWLKLARRDVTSICVNTTIYFCEDHFDLPNDMENYMEYHLMGSVSQIRMKPGCLPTRFECQPDRRKRTSRPTERSYVVKKHRKLMIEQCENDLQDRFTVLATTPKELQETPSTSSVFHTNGDHIIQEEVNKTTDVSIQANMTQNKTADKSIQVYMSHKFRSKALQTEFKVVNQMTSTIRPNLKSVSTSTLPFKAEECITSHKPSTSAIHKSSRQMFTVDNQSDSDISYTPSLQQRELSASSISFQNKSSDCSELIEHDRKQQASEILQYTIVKITKNPRFYIGLPQSCYYLLDLITKNTNIPLNHTIMCLKKIRLNNPFRELADEFSITPSYASKIFSRSVPLLASVMSPFLVNLDRDSIKNHLPMAFRHKYNNVSCIIDCLEIEIEKPSKSLNQSLSWSEYKKANTIKYLVSCTPNGLVNYISQGYGGRITDTCLVETCDFNKCLQPGMCVMADRGFKHVEQYLRNQGVQLVRPPSVTTGVKLTKMEARETKQIASLRIHVERVIRRLREFNMLKPHACLNHNLIKILDDVITIACGLINLQDSLIK